MGTMLGLVGIIIGAGTGVQFNESVNISQSARNKYKKALENKIEAVNLVKQASEETDKSIVKLANRKKSVIIYTLPRFVEVFEKIKQIELNLGTDITVFNNNQITQTQIDDIKQASLVVRDRLSDSEFIVYAFTRGFGGACIKDSEREMSIANSAYKVSQVSHAQAENYAVILETVKIQCDMVSDVIAKLNVLLTKIIENSESIINSKDSLKTNSFNEDDRKVFMTCMNLAKALKDIVDSPIFDEKGELIQESIKTVEIGNMYINKLNSI